MCGIFGYSGKQAVDPLRLRYLATENQSRGDHSTGVYGNHLYKKAKAARDFVFDDGWYSAIDNAVNVIGHCRYATVGAKNDSKDHKEPAVVGTHNGGIFDHVVKRLVEKYKLEMPEVDSQLIYQMMVELDFDYNETLSQIDGAMALAFVRPEHPDYLYLYHRESRPLHIGYIGANMYYSSASEPLWLIECDTVEELDRDKLHIFKKGTLVEVSDVKKPLITSIKEDQTLPTWLATASVHEKTVLGISGADAAKTNATTHAQTGIPFRNQTALPMMSIGKGGQGDHTTRSHGGDSPAFSTDTTIINRVPQHLYHYELLSEPNLGRFYHSGNLHNCYLVFELTAAHDMNIKLPAWFVKLKDRPLIHCLSSHNGIGVLEIPVDLCNKYIKLQLFNPLQPEVVYEMPINLGDGGRVVEVALYIPFQETEEKLKKGSLGTPYGGSNHQGSDRLAGLYHPESKFSNWLAFVAGSEFPVPAIQGRHEELSGRSLFELAAHVLQTRAGDENSVPGHGLRLLSNYPVTPEYNQLTDILKMDKYTSGTTADELKAVVEKTQKALSSVDDVAVRSQQTLAEIQPFLEYLKEYFCSRFDSMEDEEMECNCG
jgi:hypothetical protein